MDSRTRSHRRGGCRGRAQRSPVTPTLPDTARHASTLTRRRTRTRREEEREGDIGEVARVRPGARREGVRLVPRDELDPAGVGVWGGGHTRTRAQRPGAHAQMVTAGRGSSSCGFRCPQWNAGCSQHEHRHHPREAGAAKEDEVCHQAPDLQLQRVASPQGPWEGGESAERASEPHGRIDGAAVRRPPGTCPGSAAS